jgi:hypothetical protein
MKKILKCVRFLPLAFITMIFLTAEEMQNHAKLQCVGLLSMFIIFAIMYFLLIYIKVNRYLALGIALLLWVITLVLRQKFMV